MRYLLLMSKFMARKRKKAPSHLRRLGASMDSFREARSPSASEQQTGLPADALGGSPQLLQRPVLDLTDALLADPQLVSDLAQTVGAVAGQAEAEVEYLALARPQALHQELEGL